MRVFYSALLVLSLSNTLARGAVFTHMDTPAGNHIVIMSGQIMSGDDEAFVRAVEPLKGKVFVALQSPGGALTPGLRIGLYIRQHGFGTMVADKMLCVSACGIIWVAGLPRLLEQHAVVGFHAAYDAAKNVSSPGNALIGAYYNRMGLSEAAIIKMTETSPDGMNLMSADDLRRVGIDVYVPGSVQSRPPSGVQYAQPYAPQPQVPAPQPASIPPIAASPQQSPVLPPPATPPVPAVPSAPITADEKELSDRLARQFVKRLPTGLSGLNESVVACYRSVYDSGDHDSAHYCAALDILTLMRAAGIERQTHQERPAANTLASVQGRMDDLAKVFDVDSAELRDRSTIIALDAKDTIVAGMQRQQQMVSLNDRQRAAYCSQMANDFQSIGLGMLALSACESMTP